MRAVVWDCDGVLVDSEPHSVASWVAVLGRFGSEASASDVEACMGFGYPDTYAHLAAFPSTEPIPGAEALWPMLLEALGDSFGPSLAPFADAVSCIDALAAAGAPQGVASSSRRSRVDLTLARAGLDGRFAAVVAGDEVPRSKPHPDVYLRAAALLGVPPGSCVAVEDTFHGCRSARAAGMAVVGVVRLEEQRAAMGGAGAVVVAALEPEHLLRMAGA